MCLTLLLVGCDRFFAPPISEACEHLSLAAVTEISEAYVMTRGQHVAVVSPSPSDSTLAAAFVQANGHVALNRLHIKEGLFRMETARFLLSNRRIDHDGTCLVKGDTVYVKRIR